MSHENPVLIASENIPTIWGGMAGKLLAGLQLAAHGELTLAGIHAALCEGSNQLWIYHNEMDVQAWMVTSIADYGSLKRLRLLLMGGEQLDKWLGHIDIVERWAISLGCTEAEAWVRPGLRKKLDKFKYAKAYEVVLKKLEVKASN